MASGLNYTVAVYTPPGNPTQTCTVNNGASPVTNANITCVTLICSVNTYTVGGMVIGLAGKGKDIDDRARYLLVIKFAPSFLLYYNVSMDTYAMNDPSFATLFKRRAAASAVQKLLGRGVHVVRCRVDLSDALVLRSLPAKFRASRRRA